MSEPTQSAPGAAAANKGGVSLIFIGLIAVFAAVAFELAIGRGGLIGVFAFVFIGWIVSLCLHEWGHAATAWAGGDRSVAERGYLTLNPLRYANPLMSIGLPLLFLAMGGIGFPGGAVYVNTNALRGPGWRAAVSAAGPAMNLVCLIAIGIALRFGGFNDPLTGALAFLGFLQATAVILNLLPIPGLDGFGILESIFPERERAAMASIGGIGMILFFVVIYFAPQLLAPVWNAAAMLCEWLGVSGYSIARGHDLFRFWSEPY